MMRLAAVALAVGLLACGGRRTPANGTPPDTGDAAVADRSNADAGAAGAAAPGTEPPLTAAECDRFVDHVVAVAASTLAARATGDEANTAEEIEATQIKLRSALREECLRVDRALFECALRAGDAASLSACQGAHGEGAGPR